MVRIEHVALWVSDLEASRKFFEAYFGAKSNDMYHNPRTGFKSFFLTFPDGGARMEIMTRPVIKPQTQAPEQVRADWLARVTVCGLRDPFGLD